MYYLGMSDDQVQAKVYVDYSVLSPFGALKHSAGPFSLPEADDFIKELAQHHKQLLVKAERRAAE